MLSKVVVLSALVAAVSAQDPFQAPYGGGRFPCGTASSGPDQSICDGTLTPTGNEQGVETTFFKADEPTPVGAECAVDAFSGNYYCGYTGAACTDGTNCDSGNCVAGVCTAGLGASCNGADANCNGFVYCTNQLGEPTTADVCGGQDSYCNDPYIIDNYGANYDDFVAWSSATCVDGLYCNPQIGECGVQAALGEDCSFDPDYGCAVGTCETQTNGDQICVLAASQAARHRHRRNNLCPSPFQACGLQSGSRAFECVDTMSSIEQCGACAGDAGSVDCTQLPNVDAVGCVAGVCEIWSCAPGSTYDAASASCI